MKTIEKPFIVLGFLFAFPGLWSFSQQSPNLVTSWSCGDQFTDARDGKVYNTVQIGLQCWMQQNLNVGSRIDMPYEPVDDGIIEKYCYDNYESTCDVYGGLYRWDELMQYSATEGIQGICPQNWHVPSDPEWDFLLSSIGGHDAGYKLKEAGTGHWWAPNEGATNETGFTALPAGMTYHFGWPVAVDFYDGLYEAKFWTSTQYHAKILSYSETNIGNYETSLPQGFSVRCLYNGLPSGWHFKNVTISSPQVFCMDATDTITTAGENATFTVTDDFVHSTGGSITLISGKTILLLPGTIVMEGAYLSASVTANGLYCNDRPVSPVNANIADKVSNSIFIVYPNPTTGNLNLEVREGAFGSDCLVMIENGRGEQVLIKEIKNGNKVVLSLADQLSGIYFLRVIAGDTLQTVKVIKL